MQTIRRDAILFWIEYASTLSGAPRTFRERMMCQALATARLAVACKVSEEVAADALAPIFAEVFPNAAFAA